MTATATCVEGARMASWIYRNAKTRQCFVREGYIADNDGLLRHGGVGWSLLDAAYWLLKKLEPTKSPKSTLTEQITSPEDMN
jgi:hypothetical protein